MKKAIGGYLEIELPEMGSHYHANAIAVNTGRNAFEYILRLAHFDKIFIPYYCCEVLLEPLKTLSIPFEFYSVDAQLNPILPSNFDTNNAILFINYFGIKSKKINQLTSIYENCILDNSQAFFEFPIENTPTFYSPRKFFGVADGGFVSSPSTKLDLELEQDVSLARFSHLLERIDCSAEFGYPSFVSNDHSLNNQPLKRMSKLTERILLSINYESIKSKRIDNFRFLSAKLNELNKLNFTLDSITSPLVYPLYIMNGKALKKRLISERVYVPTYWDNMRPYLPKGSQEELFIDDLVPLPIDQRLSKEDLEFIIKLVLE